MLPNFAGFGYGGDEIGVQPVRVIQLRPRALWTQNFVCRITALRPPLRMLRARYSGTASVVDMLEKRISAVVVPRVFCA